MFDEMVSLKADTRDRELETRLATSGLGAVETAGILEDRKKLHEAALWAEAAQQQLIFSRLEYDQKLKRQLSAEAYEVYRTTEALESVSTFSKGFGDVIKRSGSVDTTGKVLEEFARICAIEARGVLPVNSSGPYDSLPQVTVGIAQVQSALRRETESFNSALPIAIERARHLGWDSSLISQLERFLISQHSEHVQTVSRQLNAGGTPSE